MRFIRYLAKNANLLNILLLAIAVVAFLGIGLSLTKMNSAYTPPKIQLKAEEPTVPKEEKTVSLMPTDYAVIGETNLFHPERRIIFEKKTEEVVRPDLVLYGTMVQDAVQYAFVEDKKNPQNSPGRGSRQTVVKKGDNISGFVVSEIGTDRLVLVRGDDRMVVLLSDVAKRRNGNTTPTSVGQSQSGAVSPFGTQGTMRQQRQSGIPNVVPAPSGTPSTAPQPLPRQSIPPGPRPAAP